MARISTRVVWARDLGDSENRQLEHYYGDRKYLLLEPDSRPPRLGPYQAEAPAAPPQAPAAAPQHPLIELENVQ